MGNEEQDLGLFLVSRLTCEWKMELKVEEVIIQRLDGCYGSLQVEGQRERSCEDERSFVRDSGGRFSPWVMMRLRMWPQLWVREFI